jgi:hypothetical protein
MPRILSATALAVCAVLSFAGVVSADTTSGQVGNNYFKDDMMATGAKCVYYVDPHGVAWFQKMVVQPPSLWWPDRNSSSNNEHGIVGWKFILEKSNFSPWVVVKTSSVQKATAYEDSQSPFNTGTRAPLTKKTLKVNPLGHGGNDVWRARVRGMWYRSNGSVMGWVEHIVYWYTTKAGSNLMTSEFNCAGRS